MSGCPLATLKDGASIQIVYRSAMVATMDNQFADSSMAERSRLFYASLTLGTLEPLGMKIPENPLSAIFMVEQFCDWKFHA